MYFVPNVIILYRFTAENEVLYTLSLVLALVNYQLHYMNYASFTRHIIFKHHVQTNYFSKEQEYYQQSHALT